MGLAQKMGLDTRKVNAFHRALYKIGATKPGTAVFSATLGPMDQFAHRVSGGRFTVGRNIGGLPVAMLTTIGARSSQERINPVSVIPVGEDVALVATNYGRDRPPGWAYNLRANPSAKLAYESSEYDVNAAEVAGDLYESVFASAVTVYPGYAGYRSRAEHTIPVFLIEESA